MDKSTVYKPNSLVNLSVRECYNCENFSVWVSDKKIFPAFDEDELISPNADMPEKIRSIFKEASRILSASPRGAAALLRLCLEELLIFLGVPGETINAKIGGLVKDGLDQKVQMALDSVRVIGNESVHPGQIDLQDDLQTAQTLLGLVNFIVEKLISQPKQIDEIYDMLPDNKVEGILNRDEKP